MKILNGQSSQAQKIVTPNGSIVKQDSSGYLGIFTPNNDEIIQFASDNGSTFNQINARNGIGNLEAKIQFYTTGYTAFPVIIESLAGFYDASTIGFTRYRNIPTVGAGIEAIYGLDNRTGITAVDASPITLYTTTASGQLYRLSARAFATIGTSATYQVKWTEGGVVNTLSLVVTALDTNVSSNTLIQPDNGTNITAQITAISSTTLNVACSVEQIA